MPFTITIEKPTGEEAIAELVRVAKFYERFESGSMSDEELDKRVAALTRAVDAAFVSAPRKPRAKKSEPGAALESGQS